MVNDSELRLAMIESPQTVIELFHKVEAERDRLDFVLEGVMHFVDKWLEGDELKQDATNRAITMREKTLRIIENQQAEIIRLKKLIDSPVLTSNIMRGEGE